MRLAAARRRRLWSIRQLSERSGVAATTIVRAEKGRRAPTLATMRSLSAALDMDPLDIDEFRAAIDEPGAGSAKSRGLNTPGRD